MSTNIFNTLSVINTYYLKKIMNDCISIKEIEGKPDEKI